MIIKDYFCLLHLELACQEKSTELLIFIKKGFTRKNEIGYIQFCNRLHR